MTVKQAGEVGVHAFVTANKLVGEGETWHEAALLNPENSAERSGEENSFDSGESDETLSKAVRAVNPLESPVSLLSDGGDVSDGLEEEVFLFIVSAEGVDQDGVGF